MNNNNKKKQDDSGAGSVRLLETLAFFAVTLTMNQRKGEVSSGESPS